ncbi:Transcriptional regulator [Planctomycetales bacterium 10988]|nr:Transcriptional regulator [Planctomycetales bacterium 10988]
MSDSQPLRRQWNLIRLLSRQQLGVSLKELSEQLGVSQKTVRRDLTTLQDVGFLLEECVEEHGRKRWQILMNEKIAPLGFTLEEVAALYLGRRFLEPLAGTIFWEASQKAFQKIRTGLGDEALRYLEKMAVALHCTSIGHSDYSQQAETIDLLMIGIEDRKATKILYRSAKAAETTDYEVHPYGLVSHRQALYLIAFAPEHEQIRHYKVNRIRRVEVQTQRYSSPQKFDLQHYLEHAFGIFLDGGPIRRARVKFLPPVVQYVREHRWHSTQQFYSQEDGSLVVDFNLASFEELKSWVQSFGPDAIVLEPEDLREEVLEELNRLIQLYLEHASVK